MNPSYRGAEFNNYYPPPPPVAQPGQPSPGLQPQHNHMQQPGFMGPTNNHPSPHPHPPPTQTHPNAYMQQQLPRHQHPPHPSVPQAMPMHHHPQMQEPPPHPPQPMISPMMNSRNQMGPSPIQHPPPMHQQSPAPVPMQHNNQIIDPPPHPHQHSMPSMHPYHPAAQQPPPPQPIPQPPPPHHLSSPMQNHHHHHHQHHQPPPPHPPHVGQTQTPPGHYIPSPTMINQQQPHPQTMIQQPIHHHQQHHQHQQPPPLPLTHHHSHQTPGLERSPPFLQNISQTEIRIMDFNKRLTHRPRTKLEKPIPDGQDQSVWWQKFASDFFDDDCMIALRVRLDDRLVEFTIGRTLIPKFFRTYFDGGVDDLSIKLRNSREITQANMITLDCEQTLVITKNVFYHSDSNTTINALVHTEGHLTLDFRSDSLLIKTWRFHTTHCNEFIDRTFTGNFAHDGRAPNTFLVESVTKHGLPTKTLSYLKMCQVIEPMQSLMSMHKQTQMEPRVCLKTLLHDKFKVKNLEDTRALPNKRRKRKAPNAVAGATATAKKSKANANNANMINNNNNSNNNNNNSNSNSNSTINNGNMISSSPLTSGTPNMISLQDAMVVGEPTMLAVELGDENERKITRLANNQFEANQMYNSNPDSNSIAIDQSLDCNSLNPHGQGQSKCNNDTVSPIKIENS